MATNYQKGYQLEYKTKKIFEDEGWLATRSPASHSPIDLYVMGKKKNLLIQCKTTSKDKLYIYGLGELIEKAKENEAVPLLVYSLRYTPPYVMKVENEKVKLKREEEHKKLEEYLKEIDENGA